MIPRLSFPETISLPFFRSRLIRLLSVALALAFMPVAIADNLSVVDSLLQEAQRETAEANYPEAETHIRRALSLAGQTTGKTSTISGRISRQLANFLISRGRTGEAERYMQRALMVLSGYSGAIPDSEGEYFDANRFATQVIQNPDTIVGSPDVAETLSDFANLRAREGRFNDAERLLRRCVGIYAQGSAAAGDLLNYVPDALLRLFDCQRRLGDALSRQGKFLEAESMYKTYVETVRKEKGASPELAEALGYLSSFYRGHNYQSEADAAEAESKELKQRFR